MRRISVFFAVILFIVTASAAPVSRHDAKAIASSFFLNKGLSVSFQESAFKAPARPDTQDDNSYFYIFNAENENGFVIVSGDDRTEQILGYADEGSIDEENMPENLRSWLQVYADQIRFLDDYNIQTSPATAQAKAMRKASRVYRSIAPMLACKWSQSDPYNRKCPLYYDVTGNAGLSVTGCVATAIAQVLYFHKYPAETHKAIPEFSRTYSQNDGTTKTSTLEEIPAGTKIDWEHMLDNYNGSETDEEKDAVAELMLMIGQKLKVTYGPSTGSSYADSRSLLVDCMDYDDEVLILRSDNYGIQEWFDMMYDELAAGYPIAYGGSSTKGGHAFVFDGFDGDELFHVNWGWSGNCNGYFRITVLNPDDNSGIGASLSSDGYSMAQDAIMYLRPGNDGIDAGYEPDVRMTINDTSINGTKIVSNYINWTGSVNSFNGAIVMEDDEGLIAPVSEVKTYDNLPANTYVTWTLDLKGKFSEPGTYRLSPASKLKSAEIWRPLYNLKDEYIQAEVDENLKVKLTKVDPEFDLEVTNWEFPGTMKVGEQQEVVVSITNHGEEFKQEMAFYASVSSDKGDSQSRALVCLKENESGTFSFFFTPKTTGTYILWLTLNNRPEVLFARTTVGVNSTVQNSVNLTFSGFAIPTEGYVGRAKGTATFTNNSDEDFNGKVKLQLWQKEQYSNSCWTKDNTVGVLSISAGEKGTIDFDFTNLDVDRTYFITAELPLRNGNITNAGLIWDHSFNTKSGLLYWNADGTIGGVSPNRAYKVGNETCALLVDGASIEYINASSANVNAIYAFTKDTNVPEGLENMNVVIGNDAEEINLTTANPVIFPVNFTAKKATLSHTFTKPCDGKSGFDVITFPFCPESITIDGETIDLTAEEKAVFVKEFSEETDENEVIFTDATLLYGHSAYVIGAKEELVGKTIVFQTENALFTATEEDLMYCGSECFGFKGLTYSPVLKDVYVLNEEGSAFEFSAEATTSGKGGYFITKLNEEARPAQIFIAEGVNAISNVTVPSIQNTIYDLQGRKVVRPAKGLYIVNGKKTIIK